MLESFPSLEIIRWQMKNLAGEQHVSFRGLHSLRWCTKIDTLTACQAECQSVAGASPNKNDAL